MPLPHPLPSELDGQRWQVTGMSKNSFESWLRERGIYDEVVRMVAEKVAREYHYSADWSEADREHVARCAEFPSLSYLHRDVLQASWGIFDAVHAAIVDMIGNGEQPPKPAGDR